MRLLVINPNTTVAMTALVGTSAREFTTRHGPAAVEIVSVNPATGPAAIESPEDEQTATAAMLTELPRWLDQGADAAIVACFGDPGIDEIRAASGIPTVGIAAAAMHAAATLGARFSIVCASESAVSMMQTLADRYRLADSMASVRASGVSVLDIAADPTLARDRISAAIARCIAQDGAQAILLGCASMARLTAELQAEHSVPIIDGVRAATSIVLAVATA